MVCQYSRLPVRPIHTRKGKYTLKQKKSRRSPSSDFPVLYVQILGSSNLLLVPLLAPLFWFHRLIHSNPQQLSKIENEQDCIGQEDEVHRPREEFAVVPQKSLPKRHYRLVRSER